jgi:DNA-binding response OmpR family regulator
LAKINVREVDLRPIAAELRATKRILYIDQSEDCRCLMTILLEAAGYEVNTTTTIASGKSIIKLLHFDLFILESSFIDGLGIDLCRFIRTVHPQAPIIFFSTSADSADITAARVAGATDYLTKPTDIRSIEQTIRGLLGQP